MFHDLRARHARFRPLAAAVGIALAGITAPLHADATERVPYTILLHGEPVWPHAWWPLVALAFECQLFDKIPMQDHDVYMDKVITEKAVYNGRGRK